MNFKGRLKILEMSRLAWAETIGRDLVRGVPRSNTFVKLLHNLPNALTRCILKGALKCLKCRVLARDKTIGRDLVRGPPFDYLCQITPQCGTGIKPRNFKGRLKILEMSRLPRAKTIGRDLVREAPLVYNC